MEPGGVGDEDAGVAPAGGSGGGAEDVGGDVGEGSGGGLGVGDVEHEFVGEGVDVEVVGSGAPEGSGVAHPAEAFVALRAVGGDGDEVASLAPGSELIHLVERLAGAGESDGGGLGKAVVDEAVEGREGGRSGGLAAEEGELDVAEAVEGEGRGPGFVAGAGEGVGVGGVGVAEVGGVDAAVGVETLGVAEARDGAARAADVQADVADHVLSHVVDGGVGGVGGIQADGVEGEGGADGEVGLRGEGHGAVGRGRGRSCAPVRGVEVGGAPAGLG